MQSFSMCRVALKGEHPKAWGNCVLMVMLARIVDAFCPRNLPAEDPTFGDQPDGLAAGRGGRGDVAAGVAWWVLSR